MDQLSLFDEQKLAAESITGEVLAEIFLNGRDPRKGGDYFYGTDDLYDNLYYGNATVGDIVEVPTVGTIKVLAQWGEYRDETPVGIVLHHVETNKDFLMTGTYSSWGDSTYKDFVEAEPYEFTETRWRAV